MQNQSSNFHLVKIDVLEMQNLLQAFMLMICMILYFVSLDKIQVNKSQ